MEYELVTCHGKRRCCPCPCQESRLPSGKDPGTHRVGGWEVPTYGSGRLEEEINFLTLPQFEPRTVHPVVYSLYLSRDAFEILFSVSCEILKK
jgi:hypothetical protein